MTDNYLRVAAYAGQKRWNEVDEVELAEIKDDVIWGKIV